MMIRILLLILLMPLAACHTKAPAKIQSDDVLFKEGMHYFNRGSYISATDYFMEIKNRFPESPYLREAKLKLAESYFESGEYIDAEIEYQQFTTLHPLHPNISEVWFKLGMAQFKQAPKSAQKDLKQVAIAKNTFMMVTQRWPASEDAQKSKEMIQQCVDKEIEKQLYLARFYLRTKKHKVAQKKLEEVSLDQTKNTKYIGERNILLAQVYIKNDQKEDAKKLLEAILRSDDLIDFHMESKKYLSRIK